MTGPFDVAIVGAGPAGSSVAAGLARRGARVALLERSVFPREKLCGGFVSPEARTILRRLGIEGAPSGRFAPIHAYRFTTPAGRSAGSDLPVTVGPTGIRPDAGAPPALAWGISRFDFDAWLASHAVAAGARLYEASPVVAVAPGAVGWELTTAGGSNRPGAAMRIESRLLVLCEGRHGRLAGLLCGPAGLPAHGRERRLPVRRERPAGRSRLAFRALLDAPAGLPGTVELHFFPGGYLGLQPAADGLTNACGIVDTPVGQGPASLEGLLKRAADGNPRCAERLAGARRVGGWLALGDLRFGAGRPLASGAFLAGDASGTIEPVTGEGITMAIAAGELLTRCLAPVLEGRTSVETAARAWQRGWSRTLRPRLRLCPLLAAAARRPLLLESAAAVLGRRAALARTLVALTRTALPSPRPAG